MTRLRTRTGRPKDRPNAHPITENCQPVVADLMALQDRYGMTDLRLCTLAGYSELLPILWRQGKRAPRLATLADFAEVFGHEVRLVPKTTVDRPIYIPKFLPRR